MGESFSINPTARKTLELQKESGFVESHLFLSKEQFGAEVRKQSDRGFYFL